MSLWRRSLIYVSLVMQLGITMVVAVYLGFRVGWWLDELLNVSMVFTLVGTLLGVGAGFLSIYQLIMRSMERAGSGDDDTE